MKTLNNLRSLGLGLMVLLTSAVFAGGIAVPNPINANTQYITYVVTIVPGSQGGSGCSAFILITNEKGQIVAPAQAFRPGVMSYTFKEKGPVSSDPATRVARMVPSWEMKCSASNTYAPDAKTGTFKVGQTYLFKLVPIAVEVNKN